MKDVHTLDIISRVGTEKYIYEKANGKIIRNRKYRRKGKILKQKNKSPQ